MKPYYKLLLFPALCMSLLTSLFYSAQAQDAFPTATPTAAPSATQQPDRLSLDSTFLPFAQIRRGDIQLVGPYDSTALSFSLPASWELTGSAELNLSMGIAFNTVVQGRSGGTLTIKLNNIILETVQLDELGEVERRIAIPPDAFFSSRNDGRMSLGLTLNSGESCNTIGAHTEVFIHSTSFMVLPHQIIHPSTNLVNFPRPIYQNSFIPDSVLLIIPDKPSNSELKAALTVAAGLGKLGGDSIKLDLTTLSQFVREQSATTIARENHLIFVGKISSLPLLGQFSLPLSIENGQFQNSDETAEDGIIQMVDSPWSTAHVMLVVSGNSDPAVIKSAQALSTGTLRPSRFPNLAVIKQVNPTSSSPSPQPIDQTLTDLGYDGVLFDTRGFNSEEFIFNIPADTTLSQDSYIELVFGHSALIDYNTSVVAVLLNGQPIGSVRLTDVTASQPTNRVKIMLPPAIVVPGKNRLEVDVDINPINICTDPDVQGLWVNIWPESKLHLPLTPATFGPLVVLQDLATYPAPFVYDPVLKSTAFVLENDSLQSWRFATKIASYLGSVADGSLTELSAFFGDAIPEPIRADYNLLVIGRPTQLPIVNEMNASLPAPFINNSDIASDNFFQVQFRIPPDSPMGYIETMVSPWSSDKVVLALLGNTTQGVGWAASALLDTTLRSRLGGNFAVINDRQIITANTNLASITTGENSSPTELPNAALVPTALASLPSSDSRPSWILPLLTISLLLIVIILVSMTIGNRSKNRERGNVDKPL